jgi:hopanoid biosynthesis associated protein HpnK
MKRYLIINGDDFGLSEEVNQGIILAHQKGILTSASLMVAEDYYEDAVKKAKENPDLGVGLHLTLVCGKSVLSRDKIPHLVHEKGYFLNDPIKAGLMYQFNPKAQQELRLEIKAQLEKFRESGLQLSHLDGHLHFHVHPIIINILAELSQEFSIPFIRFPYEEFKFSFKLNNTHWLKKRIELQIFRLLRNSGIKVLKKHKINYISRVYGLLATGNLSEDYLLNLLPKITENHLEIYGHPAIDTGEIDLNSLVSEKVKTAIIENNFTLVNYHQSFYSISQTHSIFK